MSPDSSAATTAVTGSRKHPTISIAMCTFNGERFLEEQFESFLKQTWKPDQVVICDDGSTDATRSLLTEFAKNAPFTVELKFNARTLGVTQNFEQAIMTCTGDLIALSDQDDRWQITKLQRLAELLEANPQAAFACSNAQLINTQGKPLRRKLWDAQKINPATLLRQPTDFRRDYVVRSNCLTGATMMLRRERLRNLFIPIPTRWGHDHWLAVLSEILNCPGCTTPELLTQYRLHPGQTIGLKARSWFPWRRTTTDKSKNFLNREQRYQDLQLHLESKILPLHPEASVWIDVINQARQRLAGRMQEEDLPWWQREWNRMWRRGRHLT